LIDHGSECILVPPQELPMTLSAATIRKTGWSLAAGLLLLPALAMAFTDEMNWGPGDFLAAALLLGTTGVVLEIVAVLPRRQWRTMGMFGGLAMLLLVWAALAVGIFH
jgi:hypothetical protein